MSRGPAPIVHLPNSGILDHLAAYRAVAMHVAAMPRLGAIMRRRRMFSLHQLAAFAPDLLTPAALTPINRDLRAIEKEAGHGS